MGTLLLIVMAWFGIGLAAAALNVLHMAVSRLARRRPALAVLPGGYAESPAPAAAPASAPKVPVAA